MVGKGVTQVVGYVPEMMKEWMRRIKLKDRRMSESRLVDDSLAVNVPQVAQRLGVPQPKPKPAPRG
jgi:hypothetical protein